MRRIRYALPVLLLALSIALTSVPLSAATTVTGRVGPNGERVWGFVPFGDGQTFITLSWGKRSADLFVVLTCTSDGLTEIFGVGASVQDRIQRIEAGAFGDACSIAVSSFEGSASFRLSVESSVGDALSAGLEAGGAGAASVPTSFRLVPMESGDFPGLADRLERLRGMR